MEMRSLRLRKGHTKCVTSNEQNAPKSVTKKCKKCMYRKMLPLSRMECVNAAVNEMQVEIQNISTSISSFNERIAEFRQITQVPNDHSARLKNIENDIKV